MYLFYILHVLLVTSDQLADNQSQNDQDQQIALPAGLKNFFIIVPSKIRLVGLISFILNKFVVSVCCFLNSNSS